MKPPSPRLKAWLWFLGIYLVSVAAFALVTGLLHLLTHTE